MAFRGDVLSRRFGSPGFLEQLLQEAVIPKVFEPDVDVYEAASDHDCHIRITDYEFLIEVFLKWGLKTGIGNIHNVVACILCCCFTIILGHVATEIMTEEDQTESTIEWWINVGCWSGIVIE